MQLAPTSNQNVTADHSNDFTRHRGPITCVACIPNRDAAVTSGYDGAVAWVDLATSQIELMGYHDHLVNRVTVNAEGTKAASVSSDYSIYIWDLESRIVERVLLGHSDDVEDFAFVNTHIGVSVARDSRVLVWNLETGAITRVIDGHEKDVLSVAFDNGHIYSSGDDMTLRVWNLADGSLVRKWGPFEHETDSCAVDAMRKRVVLGCDDGKLRIFDVVTGESIVEIPAHKSGIKKVAISPANGDILSVAYDRRAHVWRADDLQAKLSLESHSSVWERSFNWSPDGSRFVAGTFDGTVVTWDAETGARLNEIGDVGRGNSCLNDVAATDAGDIVVVADDGFLRLGRMSQEKAEWIAKAEPPTGRVLANAVAIDEERGIVVAGAHDHTICLFEHGGDELDAGITVRLGEGPVNAIRISQQGASKGQLFCACYSGAIARVGRDAEILGTIRVHEGAVKSLSLHPSEPAGVSCSADGALLAWDFEGCLLRQYPGHTAIVDDVDFDPDGRCIVSVSRDFTAKVYEFDSGRLLHSFALGRRSPKGVCFWSPTEIIITNYWGAVMRIDLVSGTMTERQVAQNGVSAISRCGEHVVVVSYDGSAHLLDPQTLEPVSSIATMTQRLAPSRLF